MKDIMCYMTYTLTSMKEANMFGKIRPNVCLQSWNSTGKIGLIGRHRAEKPDAEVTMCLGPMRPIFPVEFQLKAFTFLIPVILQ